MDSRLAKELKVRYQPVATILSDEAPPGALQFKEGSKVSKVGNTNRGDHSM